MLLPFSQFDLVAAKMMGLLKMPWASQHPHEGLDRHLLEAMAPPAASVAPDTNAARESHLHFAPEVPYGAGNRRAYTVGLHVRYDKGATSCIVVTYYSDVLRCLL
jgi:hypothetical protein